MGVAEVTAFLTSLAVHGKLAASTQNQALEESPDIRTVQALLGHHDVSTTMVYTHVLNRGSGGVRRPADRMFL